MVQPILTYNDGFQWIKAGRVSFKGYFLDPGGRFMTGASAARAFENVESMEQLSVFLKHIDGAYSVIIRTASGLLAGVDPMRMFPLFYRLVGQQWHLSDSAEALLGSVRPSELQGKVLPEFLSAGFVMGKDTLVPGIQKTNAAEVLLFNDAEEPLHHTYSYFLPEHFFDSSAPVLKEELHHLLQGLSRRIIESLQGRTAIVPLSGGYDSRLIACMLKMQGYERVVCMTYGRPNKESRISRRVAEQLGYRWEFVDYTDIPAKGLTDDPVFLAWAGYSGNLSSMPYLQDYFAVKTLKENNLIPEDSVFLPGHTGDYLAGSYTEKTIRIRRHKTQRTQRLLNGYFRFFPLQKKQKEMILGRLREWFEDYQPPAGAIDEHYDVLTEDWDLKEKFSSFVFNSAGVFPFFGYEFRLPLWDKQFREFFRKVPFSLRSHKKLYNEVLEERYFIPMKVHYHREEISETPNRLRIQRIKDILRPLVPGGVRHKRMAERDYLCYERFTLPMRKSLEQKGRHLPGQLNSFNAIITHWYADRTQEMVSRQPAPGSPE
ncbi:MAG: hypothetical protein ACLFS0_07270 [Bacteroidales bacterium]